MKHILSFDIAKGKSVYCFIDELKNVIIDATFLIVIMESTSIYHLHCKVQLQCMVLEILSLLVEWAQERTFNINVGCKILHISKQHTKIILRYQDMMLIDMVHHL